jgi:hypothetical protein
VSTNSHMPRLCLAMLAVVTLANLGMTVANVRERYGDMPHWWADQAHVAVSRTGVDELTPRVRRRSEGGRSS